ncbi:unnamed protein product [Diamesa serratosioi]
MTGRGFSIHTIKNVIRDETKPEQSKPITTPSMGRGLGRLFSIQDPTLNISSAFSTSSRLDDHLDEDKYRTESVKSSVAGAPGRGFNIFNAPSECSSGSQLHRLLSAGISSHHDEELNKISTHNETKTSKQDSGIGRAQGSEIQSEQIEVLRHGSKGTKFTAMSNSIKLHSDPESGVFEYEVRFNPQVDSLSFRSKYLLQHRDVLGNARTFDGVTLFLPNKLPLANTTLISKHPIEDHDISIQIIFKRQKRLGDCIHLYNVLFDRIFKILNFTRVGRKNFDPSAPKMIPQHKLEVWPGYVSSVEEQEGGLMLSLDVSHRVLCQKTVLEFLSDCYRQDSNNFKENAKKALIGSVVLTRYNNKTYRIDDILFEHNPLTTFKRADIDVTYVEYYKTQYNIEITDFKQPLLINRKEVRISGQEDKKEFMFCLVPEICYLTGLTDQMRKNFSVMKDLAVHTKLSPYQRVGSFKKFIDNINNTPAAKEVLANWGLSIDKTPLIMNARLFEEQTIHFGKNMKICAGPNADFSRGITQFEVLEPIDLQSWILLYTRCDEKQAESFVSMMMKVAGPTGIRVAQPVLIKLQNDRTETYVQAIRKELTNPQIQIVVIIFPTMRDDRYAAVKRICCTELPIPSQVINSKTLRNETKNRSIVQKIALQMNCKMGGTLWSIKIPFQKVMICGIDTYHEANHKANSVTGFIASLNGTYTRWYSKAIIQKMKEEIGSGLTASLGLALAAYYTHNNYYPEKIIVYRDGVGDGQLRYLEEFEIPQMKMGCKQIAHDYSPLMTYIVVQKRINNKFFQSGPDGLKNPLPGSVLDHTITRKYMYDFYMIAQHVREGTTTPSHYIVVQDENNFSPDILQQLTYKLCFLYYNWPGTVRVPAPCQYAHKLAYLVGLSVKRTVDEKLCDKLFFL